MSYCNGLSVTLNFNPRSPCGERHRIHLATGSTAAFQSTLPVWGATGAGRCRGQGRKISIHAPRVGSDRINVAISILLCHFNPRSPCGERPRKQGQRQGAHRFQSTLPVWGATRKQAAREQQAQHFNPRSPCGERQFNPEKEAARTSFQSTLPVWGATPRRRSAAIGRSNFNPRSPCGERPAVT